MNWNETSFEGVKGHVLKELYYSLVFVTKLTHGKTCQISFFCVLLPCMNTEAVIVSIVFACCAAVHFVGMLVMAILARHRDDFLWLPCGYCDNHCAYGCWLYFSVSFLLWQCLAIM